VHNHVASVLISSLASSYREYFVRRFESKPANEIRGVHCSPSADSFVESTGADIPKARNRASVGLFRNWALNSLLIKKIQVAIRVPFEPPNGMFRKLVIGFCLRRGFKMIAPDAAATFELRTLSTLASRFPAARRDLPNVADRR
jgi:hypothetical protein